MNLCVFIRVATITAKTKHSNCQALALHRKWLLTLLDKGKVGPFKSAKYLCLKLSLEKETELFSGAEIGTPGPSL